MSRLRAGTGTALGGWVTTRSTVAAERMGAAGFDFLVLDAQHGEADTQLLPLVRSLGAGGATVLARVGWPDPRLVMRALDEGAEGVIVPMIEDADQARVVAAACRYAPAGNRSFGPMVAGPVDAVLCLPMVETRQALDRVEAIAATEGVDGLFVGPVDLALALGVPASAAAESPELDAALVRVLAAARANGVLLGTIALSDAHARHLIELGVDFLSLGSDAGFILQGAKAKLAGARPVVKEMTV